jgi:hypothetical protein
MRRLVLALLLVAPSARAADEPQAEAPPVASAAPKPWLYLDDPTLPRAASAFTRVTYTQSHAAPFAADVARPGAVLEAGAEASLLPWLSVVATGAGAGDAFGGSGGLRVSLLPREASTHLVVAAGGARELSGDAAAWGRIAFGQDIGRARVGAMVHGEHAFGSSRDALDVTVSAGASAAIVGPLRAGVEWVGQDLEGAVDRDEAEGGMRHFAGPTAAVELLGKRLTIGAGPAFGLSHNAPPIVVRGQAAYAF